MTEQLAVPVALQRGRPVGWWAVLLLVTTEGALFAAMIASYFYLRFRAEQWPPPGTPQPKVLVPTGVTAMLVLSSLPLAWAVWGAKRHVWWRAAAGLGVAAVLGVLFVIAELHLIVSAWHKSGAQRDAYDSITYTLQGAHLAHVVAAVLINLFLLAKISRRRLTQYRVNGIWAMSLYWHFVNALAILVLVTAVSPAL